MKRLTSFAALIGLFASIVALPWSASADEGQVTVGMSSDDISVTGKTTQVQLSELTLGVPTNISSGDFFKVTAEKINPAALQLVITLDSSSAATEYTFKFADVAEIVSVSQGDTVVHQLVNSSGSTLGWLSSPWAFDAIGNQVKTYYKFSGGKVVQVIDTSDDEIVYPVTADPFLFIDLISDVNIWYQGITRNLKIAVSPWMGVQYIGIIAPPWGYTAAVEVAQSFGWQEVLVKIQTKYGITARNFITSKSTYKNQWDCHALGAPAIFGATLIGEDKSPTWDLEGYRSSTTNLATWINTGCNW